MNYFELYPGDYLRDTGTLTLAEHGAFLLLMAAYYATEKPLPSDNPTLFRLVRAMTEDEQKAAIKVAEMYFPISDEDGLRHNVRADQEIPKARARIEAARENGKRGGRPPKPKSNPLGFDPVTYQEPSGVPSTKAPHTPYPIQEQRSKSLEQQAARKTSNRFDEFWKVYPVKKGKAEAEKKWKAKGYDAMADRIIADVVQRCHEDRQWLDGYAPHGSTYINAKGWEDDIERRREQTGNGAMPDYMVNAL